MFFPENRDKIKTEELLFFQGQKKKKINLSLNTVFSEVLAKKASPGSDFNEQLREYFRRKKTLASRTKEKKKRKQKGKKRKKNRKKKKRKENKKREKKRSKLFHSPQITLTNDVIVNILAALPWMLCLFLTY